MNRPARQLEEVAKLDPRDAATTLAAVHRHERGWLDEFAAWLDRHRSGQSLERILEVWDINQSEAARHFGVSRQAVSKWLETGVPGDRAEAVADLAAATDLLVHYLKRERIPAVVRRPIVAMEGRSLLEMLAAGDTRKLLRACRDMFQFERAQH